MRAGLLGFVVVAGCVAPMGVGAGPVHVPGGSGIVTGSAGFGVGASREQFQADGAMRLQPRSWFSIEGGLVYSTLRDRDGDREVVLHSGMPYVRPTFYWNRLSLGVALSGLGAGGGGGGAAWGMIEPRLGYGAEAWSVYVSWLRHGATQVGGSTLEISAEQWRLAGDYYWDVGGVRLGVAAQVVHADDCIRYVPGEGSDQAGGTWAERYTMGVVQLRVASGAL